MSNSHPPAFLFYPNDFAADGKVEAMTTEQVGGYILLLCKAWWEEPAGSIPNNDNILAKWARMDGASWAESKVAVLSPFTLGNDNRWHQKRMRSEWEKLYAIRKRREKAGKIAASERWDNNPPLKNSALKSEKIAKKAGLQPAINKDENANRIPIACESHTNRIPIACISSSSSSSSSKEEEENAAQPGKRDKTQPNPRPRNPYWDSMVAVWGAPVTRTEQSRFGKAASEFADAKIDPNEIPIRHARVIKSWKTLPCSPETLLKHWSEFESPNGNGNGNDPEEAAALAKIEADVQRTKRINAENRAMREQAMAEAEQKRSQQK